MMHGRAPASDTRGAQPLARVRELGGDALRVARFLRGLRAYRPRPGDVYISSYPRSGTTWTQLLVHLLRGGDASFPHIAAVVPWFERQLALGRMRAADFQRDAGVRAFKSHLPHAWLPRGARYVYVHRDGRDVAVSYYYFYRSHLGFQGGFDDFFGRFLRGELQYGSWFRHVADWRRAAARPDVCMISYEELQRDPERALRRLAELCAVPLGRERCREILDLSSFAAMKRDEDKFDHATHEPRSSAERGEFLRRGRVGSYRELFSPGQLARFSHTLAQQRPARLPELRLAAFLH